MRYLYAVTAAFLFPLFLVAQDLDVTKYPLGDVIDDPTLAQFAPLTDGTAYFLYRYFASGRRDNAMLRFDGDAWTPVDTLCARCIRHLLGGPDGKLYVAAGEEGLYRRDDGTWTQLLDVEANYLAFSPDGTLYLASDQGISTYDGTTLTPGDATGLPASFRVNDMEFSGEGTLYVLAPGSLYTYDTTTGFTARTEVTSPLHIAAHPDGRLYVADNFGQIGYYDNGAFTNRAITGVFSSNVGLVDFDISSDGIFWGSQQGIRPGVIRYDGTTASTPLAPGDLVDDAILIGPLTAASGGRVFVGSDLRPGIAVIQDPTTSIFSTSTPTLSLGIYPNPVRDRTQIRLVAPRTGTAALRLLDVTGRPLFTETLRVVAGEFTHELSLKNLATGVYFVEMSFGEQRALGRLQKQ